MRRSQPRSSRAASALGCWLAVSLLASVACRGASSSGTAAAPAPAPAAGKSLPELRLTDETPQLLLTWIGDDGDFHVEEAIDKVPAERRARLAEQLAMQAVLLQQPVELGAVAPRDARALRDVAAGELQYLGQVVALGLVARLGE